MDNPHYDLPYLQMEFSEMVLKECEAALLKKYRNPYHLMCQGVPIPKAVIEHSGPLTRNVDKMFRRGVVYGQQMFDATGKVDLMVFMPKSKL